MLFGVNVYVPSAFTTITPTPGMFTIDPAAYVTPLIVNCVTVKAFPSGSVSFVNTFPETGVSSSVVTTSFTASGASFTGETVIPKFAVFEPPLISVAV